MCVIKLTSFALFRMKEIGKMKSAFEMIYFYFLTLLNTIFVLISDLLICIYCKYDHCRTFVKI